MTYTHLGALTIEDIQRMKRETLEQQSGGFKWSKEYIPIIAGLAGVLLVGFVYKRKKGKRKK